MPDRPMRDAVAALERMRAQLCDQPLDSPAGPLAITFSAGVVENLPGETVAQRLERADILCYRAKVAGRDRIEPAAC